MTSNIFKRAMYVNKKFMYMKLFVDSNDIELKNNYISSIYNHNNKMLNNKFPDSGFDLFVPNLVTCYPNTINKIDFKVKCSAVVNHESGLIQNSGFYLFPRSSLSGKPLRLANSVGIIDSGYRGNLIGAFDCIDSDNFVNCKINKLEKLVQICSPGLIPIIIELVDDESELGEKTDRGDGGFGSTSVSQITSTKRIPLPDVELMDSEAKFNI